MLTRWDPFSEIARIEDHLARLVPNARPEAEPRFDGLAPPVDVYESGDAIVLAAELPGFRPEEIHVSVENERLLIRGERKAEKPSTKDGWHRIERRHGTFSRSFALPKTVDGDRIEARLDQGVLELRLPKRPVPAAKRIEVMTGERAPKEMTEGTSSTPSGHSGAGAPS